MKKFSMFILLLAVISAGPVFSDLVSFKLGYFFPRASSDLWITEFDNMTLQKSDYTSSIFGFSYEYFMSPQIAIQVSIDGRSKQKSGLYLEYDGLDDFDGRWAYPIGSIVPDFTPQHQFSVSATPIQMSVKFTPFGRSQRIIPYIGGGVGLYIWSVRLQGEFVDFDDVYEDVDLGVLVYPIDFADVRDDNKLAVGFQALGGVIFPLASRISVEAEVKYNFAKGTMNDFIGFESFDLGGIQFGLAMNYWF